jgi:ankyrin repeat protein
VNKQEQDSKMVVVEAMAKQPDNMDPHLLALASSGSSEKLQALLNRKDGQSSGQSTDKSLTTRRVISYGDTEANESILERKGITAEGSTALHVVAASGQGDNFFTRSREAKHLLVDQHNKKRHPTCTERHALTTYGYGDGDNFLESARIIYGKAKHLLFVQNNKGDTPLHCAARAGKSNMVACLIDLASAEGEDRIKELLRKENKHKETALHEAVRVGNNYIVNLLMEEDSELASFPEDVGTSPMYLAIMQKRDEIVKTLYDKSSDGKLSFSGPNRQNALHAAVL